MKCLDLAFVLRFCALLLLSSYATAQTYYASPTGLATNPGTQAQPFRIGDFYAVAGPGKTLILLDGEYKGSDDHAIKPPVGLNGTSAAPITVKSLNDGGALINGDFVRSAVRFDGNSWWVFEGFNGRNGNNAAVVWIAGGSNNIVFRRCVFWDALINQNNNVVGVHGADTVLFEDVAMFGVARKIFSNSQFGNNVTLRRCWIRKEGSTFGGIGSSMFYKATGGIFENVLITWSGESLPHTYNEDGGIGAFRTNFDAPAVAGIIAGDRIESTTTPKHAYVELRGSISYTKASDRIPNLSGGGVPGDTIAGVMVFGASSVTLTDVVRVMDPNHPRFNDHLGFVLLRRPHNCPGCVGCPTAATESAGPCEDPVVNNTATRLTSIRGTHSLGNNVGDSFGRNGQAPTYADETDWLVTGKSVGTSLAAVQSPWQDTSDTGARLLYRWGQPGIPLWPWPMNQRIKDATQAAGAFGNGYSFAVIGGNKPDGVTTNCKNANGTPFTFPARTMTDVTADLTAPTMLGPIPGVGGDLVGHWKFDESSGTTAADSSGNNNTGTLTGFSGSYWVAGQLVNGLKFDLTGGGDDIVNAGSGPSLDNLVAQGGGGMTVAAWIKATTLGETGFGRIVSKAVGPTFANGWHFMVTSTNGLLFAVDHATDVLRRSNPNTIVSGTGVWQHVAVTWDGTLPATSIKIFVNGAEVSGYDSFTNGAGARPSDANSNLYLGNEQTGTRAFDGILDDVRVYNYALSASEILALQVSPPNITTTVLPAGRTTISYGNQQLTATGGTTPYTWSLLSGSMPPGINPPTSGGIINGTPTTTVGSPFNFTVRVTDAALLTDDQPLSITVNANSIPDITTTSLPAGTIGVAYNQSVNSTGGDVALVWSKTIGNFPLGLTLSNVNSQNATISGTPTAVETANFTLQLADVDNDPDTQALSITINGAPPNAPTLLTAADFLYNQINLSWTDNSSNETGFKIERKKGAGGTYTQIGTTGAFTGTGSYSDIGTGITGPGTGTNYYYRVRAYNANGDSGYSNEANDTTPEVTGRRGHWKLDENSGTAPQDSSGNANHGTMSPAPAWTTGKILSALNFDGVDDKVNCQSGTTLDNLVTQGGGGMTVAAWINATTLGETGFGRIATKLTGTGPVNGWEFMVGATNQLVFGVDYTTTNLVRRSAVNSISTGAWRHVLVTWTGSQIATNVKFYVDGVEVAYDDSVISNGVPVGTGVSDATASLYLGNEPGGARTFNGKLDDLRVYNRVLSAAEITAVHRAGL